MKKQPHTVNPILWRPLAVLLAVFLAVSTTACREERLTEAQWTGGLAGLVATASVRLNNFSPTPIAGAPPVRAFYLANDSSLTLGGVSLVFDIPTQRREPYTFYISDIRSSGAAMDVAAGRATLRISFESAGPELIGNCVENIACICGEPRVELDSGVLDLSFEVAARGGRLVLDDIRSNFSASYDEAGPCRDNACAFLCDIIRPDRASRAREAVERAATGFLNGNRGLVETALNAQVRRLGVTGRITFAKIQRNGDLLIVEDD